MPQPRSLIALACLSLPLTAAALAPVEIFSRLAPAVAILHALDEQGERLGSYSATVIDHERLATTCEVLEAAATLRVERQAENIIAARVLARDRERNLCLIAAPGLAVAPMPQLRQMPTVGSRVFALSNALGLGIGISDGVIAGIRRFPTGDYVQFSAPISPGSQGGALVDEAGQLVGIVDYRHRDGQNVNFASPAAWLDDIEVRAAVDAARLQRFDRAQALSKQRQWAELQAVAAAWSREEPADRDAWRFAIAAAKGRGDTAAEVQGWTALQRLDSTAVEAGIGLGRALLASGETQQALDLARRMQAAHSEDASLWLFLGQAQHAAGEAGDAARSYRRAVELDPWLIAAYDGMATLAQTRGDHETAIAIRRRFAGLFPGQVGPRIGLAGAYLLAGQSARAWSTLAQLPDSDADGAWVWYWKGVTLAALKCPEQAIAAFRISLDRQVARADLPWAGIGFALAEMQRFPEAIDAFRAATAAAPGEDRWRYQLAINLKDGGRAGEALPITTDLVTRKPAEAQNWRQHGFVLSVLGRPAQAIPALEKSLHIDPRQSKVWRALIDAYQATGRRDEVRRAYRQLRDIDPATAEESYHATILPYEELPQ